MAGQNQATTPNMDQFEAYFRRADLDQDSRISGSEAVSFLQGSNLPKQVLAQIWMYADQNRTGFLGRTEFYNALKLVTVAQSKRELTPDIVNAALFGPASSKIPAPQINIPATQAPQGNLNVSTPASRFSGPPKATQSTDIGMAQGFPSQQSQLMRPPRPSSSNTAFQQNVSAQAMPVGAAAVASLPQSSNLSTDLFGGGMAGSAAGVTSLVPNKGISPSTSQDGFGWAASGQMPVQPRPQAIAGLTQPVVPKPNDATSVFNHAGTRDSRTFPISGNGVVSNSLFANAVSTTSPQQNQDSLVLTSSSSGSTISPAISGPQPTLRTNFSVSSQSAPTQQPVGQHQQLQSTVKPNQQVSGQSSATFASPSFPVRAEISPSGDSQFLWPRMTHSDVQKYRKVFLQVDTDGDGKITGEQARNLFLSWRLPREVLKQVWDLSDQDNDSMLSLREFCIALYLLERHREGHPLPTALPSSITFDETLLPASNQPHFPYTNTNWRPTPGLQQAQVIPGVRSVAPAARGKPPHPVPIAKPDDVIQPKKQKPTVPVLEKHLVEQLSTGEQDSLNLKFQEATEAEKKVDELEKEILDSRQKIEFYRAKMQELVLYKSRCDNRLNEITERTFTDKREAESLAKKYEEKCKQIGDVASKLTIQEATFRDIQEKKMELYRAIVKLEQDGNDDIQAHVDKIQSNLEELVKSLNERCRTYGLRAKPTSLVELPFGWQPGIQEGAADWDEVWDKFEDEGFTFVKELTLDVQNVIAPPRPKSSLVPKKSSMGDIITMDPTPNANGNSEKVSHNEDEIHKEELTKGRDDDMVRSSPRRLGRRDATDDTSKIFDDSLPRKNIGSDGLSHATETQSELDGAESVISGDKGYGEPRWGAFDIHYDTDAAWDVSSVSSKDIGRESSYFDSDNWNLNPIRTGSTLKDNTFQKGFVFDSVPSTPLFDSTSTPHGENIFQKSSFAFAESVPSTPMYNAGNSPSRFSEMSEDRSFDSFSRFDSFGMHDSGPFPPSFSRFDSMRSTRDGDYDHGFSLPHESFSRFDSMRSTRGSKDDHGSFQLRDSFSRFDSKLSTRDSEYDHGFFHQRGSHSRFDSMSSTKDSEFDHGLFQPHESFRSFDSNHNPRDSDYDHGSFPPSESFTRFDSFRSTRDADYSHMLTSFDETDPFGSSDPFKRPLESQTPRRD